MILDIKLKNGSSFMQTLPDDCLTGKIIISLYRYDIELDLGTVNAQLISLPDSDIKIQNIKIQAKAINRILQLEETNDSIKSQQ